MPQQTIEQTIDSALDALQEAAYSAEDAFEAAGGDVQLIVQLLAQTTEQMAKYRDVAESGDLPGAATTKARRETFADLMAFFVPKGTGQ